MKTAIGVDIGGTKISMALGTERGKILARREIPTQTGSRAKASVWALTQSLIDLIGWARTQKHRVVGIGIGIPGPVDSKRGLVPHSPNLKGWKGIPLARTLKQKLRLPVVMANDANAAAAGEKIFGAGRGRNDFVYMTISTGIGGGIVIDQKLLEGASFVGGEVGHMKIVAGGERCNCGAHGCLEAYASGTAIARYAAGQIKRGKKSRISNLIPKGKKIAARYVGLAARSRDPLALETYRRAGFYLGIGVANLLNILNPQVVILGGGVLKSAPPDFWKSMLASARHEAWPEAWRAVRIVRSNLKQNIGELGALALAFEKHKK